MKVKAGQAVIDAIKLSYAAGKPVLLEGRHGIGKSQIIEQAADELGIDCIVRDLSLMEPPDLIGLPHMDGGRTRYSPPSFLPDNGKGLLVFEELNRSEKYMMAPCLQLLTARTLNDYRLPDGWLCVAAINPTSDGYDTAELDPALLSRFVRIEMISDLKSWLQWGESACIHADVLNFVSKTPDIFAASESNPRSWSYVSDMFKAYEKQGFENEVLLLTMISGLVGDSLALAFVQSSLCEEQPISAEQIFKSYGKYRSGVRNWVAKKRVDLLNATAHGVILALQNHDTAVRVEERAGPSRNLGLFIKDLPADIGRKLKRVALESGAMEVELP